LGFRRCEEVKLLASGECRRSEYYPTPIVITGEVVLPGDRDPTGKRP